MATKIRNLTHDDIDKILELERSFLTQDEEIERAMEEWSARWREEQLMHYISTGWSYGIWNLDEKGNEVSLSSYFIAQVLLYFKSNTQTLWIERIKANNPKEEGELLEVAYRFAREKHLQKVLFEKELFRTEILDNYKVNPLDDEHLWIKTTK